MLQICRAVPPLPSFPAEPSSPPEPFAAGGGPVSPPSFGLHVDTWLNLAPTCTLALSFHSAPCIPDFLAQHGTQEI